LTLARPKPSLGRRGDTSAGSNWRVTWERFVDKFDERLDGPFCRGLSEKDFT
jgi:hypothetical protein